MIMDDDVQIAAPTTGSTPNEKFPILESAQATSSVGVASVPKSEGNLTVAAPM